MSNNLLDNVEKIVVWGSNATMSERDREMYLAMRDVSAWSARMRAGYESVYGDEFPALWAAWIDGFIEYLGTSRFRPLKFLKIFFPRSPEWGRVSPGDG